MPWFPLYGYLLLFPFGTLLHYGLCYKWATYIMGQGWSIISQTIVEVELATLQFIPNILWFIKLFVICTKEVELFSEYIYFALLPSRQNNVLHTWAFQTCQSTARGWPWHRCVGTRPSGDMKQSLLVCWRIWMMLQNKQLRPGFVLQVKDGRGGDRAWGRRLRWRELHQQCEEFKFHR